MARIAGVDLPNEKRVEVGLTYIFGIGPAIVQKHFGWHRRQPRHPL